VKRRYRSKKSLDVTGAQKAWQFAGSLESLLPRSSGFFSIHIVHESNLDDHADLHDTLTMTGSIQ